METLFLTCVAIHTAACAPDVALRKPTTLGTEDANLTLWADRCHLQSFFNAAPPHNTVVRDQVSVVMIRPGQWARRGSLTLRVSAPRQRRRFEQLLVRYYRAHKALARATSYDVTVRYDRTCGIPRMIAGSYLTVRGAGKAVTLAYHPCIANFLLNRDLYRTRATLIANGDIHGPVAQRDGAER